MFQLHKTSKIIEIGPLSSKNGAFEIINKITIWKIEILSFEQKSLKKYAYLK